MLCERGFAAGRAILLGGLATGAALCACLTLVGFVFFLGALFTLDEYTPAWFERVYSLCLSSALVLCFYTACRLGWRVGYDWYRNGR